MPAQPCRMCDEPATELVCWIAHQDCVKASRIRKELAVARKNFADYPNPSSVLSCKAHFEQSIPLVWTTGEEGEADRIGVVIGHPLRSPGASGSGNQRH